MRVEAATGGRDFLRGFEIDFGGALAFRALVFFGGCAGGLSSWNCIYAELAVALESNRLSALTASFFSFSTRRSSRPMSSVRRICKRIDGHISAFTCAGVRRVFGACCCCCCSARKVNVLSDETGKDSSVTYYWLHLTALARDVASQLDVRLAVLIIGRVGLNG